MLYGLYYLFNTTLFPMLKVAGVELINGIAPIIIIILGIALLFGVNAAGRLASTVANGVFNVVTVCVGALFRAIVGFLSWFFQLMPNTYSRVREFCLRRGASGAFSTIMALVATIVVVAVII